MEAAGPPHLAAVGVSAVVEHGADAVVGRLVHGVVVGDNDELRASRRLRIRCIWCVPPQVRGVGSLSRAVSVVSVDGGEGGEIVAWGSTE